MWKLIFFSLKIQFIELDFSNLVFQKSSTDEQDIRGFVLFSSSEKEKNLAYYYVEWLLILRSINWTM